MAKSREPQAASSKDAAVLHVGPPELGEQLKMMFGEMSSGPMPARLTELADRLEEAFQRGELFERAGDCRRAS